MSRRPRIAIPVPSSIDLAYNRRCLPLYLEAVERSGGHPVPVSLDKSGIAAGLTCSAVLLPGSLADVSPSQYGQETDIACAAPDMLREATDRALLEDAEHHAKPVLGICYGLQSLNVWRGGSLLQDLSILPVNHPAGPSIAVAHTASVSPESHLGRVVEAGETLSAGGTLRLPVNSSHHQAVAALGEGLRVSARCPQDDVIEAIEADPAANRTGQFLLAVQWHPERSYDLSPTSRALFDRLVAEACR